MNTNKRFLLAIAFVMLAGLVAGASAQTLPAGPITVKVNAIEISDGVVGYEAKTNRETMFGYGFLGRTIGPLPGSFMMAMNCVPAIPRPGETSEMTGGPWTLPVYMFSQPEAYMGSIFGTVASGRLDWDKSGKTAMVYATLNIDGGTQTWDGVKGYAIFEGILIEREKGPTTLSGTLTLVLSITR